MNITPTLPGPHQLPADDGRRAVAAVRPALPARDVAQDEEPSPRPLRRLDPVEEEQAAARAESLGRRQPETGSRRADRAMTAYAEVAEAPERGELHQMLGFDAYA